MKKIEYDDDDGRTVADMSGVENQSATGFLLDSLRKRRARKNATDPEEIRAYEQEEMDKKSRRHYTMGAMGAGLLIGAVYIVAFAIVIIIMLLVMGVL